MCKVKETNQSTAVACEPMAMQPVIAHQNGGASGYIICRLPPYLRFLQRKQPSVQFIARPGTVLVPISQGTEVTKVTKYVPFRYFTHTVSMGTSSITPCYDVEQLETKTHMGLGPGESIEYIKHIVSLEGHPWPGCRPDSDTWHPYSYVQTKQRGAWTMLVKWTRKDCYFSRKDSGLQNRDI